MILPTPFLTPTLLRCSRFDGYATSASTYASRTVYEYELEYYLRSDGGIIVDGEMIPFSAGEMNIRKPGQVVQGVPPYECYILLVDMTGNFSRSRNFLFGNPEESQEAYQNPLLDGLPNRFVPNKKELIAGLFESILQNQNSTSDLAAFQVRSSLYFLFAELFQETESQQVVGNTAMIRQAVRFIWEHFAEPVSVENLIEDSGMSRSCFHRRFLEETGQTPGQFVASLRIEQAKNLLCFTRTPVGEVGALCGYPDHVYFSRIFRQQTGMSPSAYRSLTEK